MVSNAEHDEILELLAKTPLWHVFCLDTRYIDGMEVGPWASSHGFGTL